MGPALRKTTQARCCGAYRLLILDGHESHHSTGFELFCKEQNINTVCMPAHSSHILQPLDVGCFGPLKKAYGQQIEDLIKARMTRITKTDFLPGFNAAFQATMTEKKLRENLEEPGLFHLTQKMFHRGWM